VKNIILGCCIAALLTACDTGEVSYEDVDKPVYVYVPIGIPLESAGDLKKIGVDPGYPLNGDYYLAADLDLSREREPWIPIGTDRAHAFSGILEGMGKTIRGLNLGEGAAAYTGLFGYCYLATVSNLIIEPAYEGPIELSGEEDQYIGVVAGYTENTRIINVTVKGNLAIEKSGTGSAYTGGIAGSVVNGELRDCAADLALKGETRAGGYLYAGGIAGSIAQRSGAGTCKVSGCTATGSVTLMTGEEATATLCAGGITGSVNNFTLGNCTSSLRTVEAIGSGRVYVGGITGNGAVSSCGVKSPEGFTVRIRGESTGTESPTVYAGGISGYGTVEESFVAGPAEIQAESTGTPNLYAGGIAGYTLGVRGITGSYVSESNPRTKVLAKASTPNTTGVARLILAGGIAGYVEDPISDCFSAADVRIETAVKINPRSSGGIGAGGILGRLTAGVKMTGCYATGAVEIQDQAGGVLYAGGLVGYGTILRTAFTIEKSLALNSRIQVISSGPSARGYRVLGGAFNSTGVESDSTSSLISLVNNYSWEDTPVQQGPSETELTDIAPPSNDSRGFGGDSKSLEEIQIESFFSNTLQWDLTDRWQWNPSLKLPVLKGL
jgi:hypothetical protein